MTTPPAKVAAIVVSYRNKDAAARCVGSVVRAPYPGLQVIVVDNAVGDGTAEEIASRFPSCRILSMPRNLGFGAGCNAGIDAALHGEADYVLVLNQDTVVAPTLVGRLVEFLDAHPDAGVVGPKTLSTTPMPDGSPRRLYAGAWRGVVPLIQNIPGIEQEDAVLPDRPIPTDYVWGHGMMLRTAAIVDVGGFDPAFFMYCEDLDLCQRMRAAGYGVWCEPRALMWHDISDGARADNSEYWRWACKVRSIRTFYRKHARSTTAPLLSAATVLVEAKRLVRRRRFLAARHLVGAYAADLLTPRGHRRAAPRPLG